MPTFNWKRIPSLVAISILFGATCVYLLKNGYWKSHRFGTPDQHNYVKPKNISVVGLVFFGRRSRVEILQCYLKRNLVGNGGWLDEVHWVPNTKDVEDLTYLHDLLASNSQYRILDHLDTDPPGFSAAWVDLNRDTFYIKIDDDVVWFGDETIPSLVTTKISYPDELVVSANMVNSPLMSWVHGRMGALHPYLPEFGEFRPPPPASSSIPYPLRQSWHYRDYPYWTGPEDLVLHNGFDPPHENHRWLRVRDEKRIWQTPLGRLEYSTWGTVQKRWEVGAPLLYSFLENLEDHGLDRYRVNKYWRTDPERLSINFIAVWSNDILDHAVPADIEDEEWLTVILPQKLSRRVIVDMSALAVHFSFGPQDRGIKQTDLLARFRDYAEEQIC